MKHAKYMALAILSLSLLLLGGCCLKHEWLEATCAAPVACAKCGETEGEALGHDWKSATCETPKTCGRCSKTEGDVLGHLWTEATCTTDEKCLHCGEVAKKAFGHTEGEWETDSIDIVAAEIKSKRMCTVCGEVADSRTNNLTTLHSDGTFFFTPFEFIQRLNNICRKGGYRPDIDVMDDDTLVGLIWKDSQLLAGILFYDDKYEMTGEDIDRRSLTSFTIYYYKDDSDGVIGSILATLMACDPMLDVDNVKDVATEIIQASVYKKVYENNGIKYLFGTISGDQILTVSVLEK